MNIFSSLLNKNRTINLLISLITTGFVVAALELYGFLKLPPATNVTCEECRSYVPHPKLGIVSTPNFSHEATKRCGDKICYKVKYTYDQFGRRTFPNKILAKEHVLLFGCSFTFGEGLNDEDTLAFRLQSKVSSHVYNHGRPAMGPLFSLAEMRQESFTDQFEEKSGVAIYLLLQLQIQRNSISTSMPWLWESPDYRFDSNGEIIAEGLQRSLNPIFHFLAKNYLRLKQASYFLSYLDRDFFSQSDLENEKKTVNILKNMKRTYEEKTGGKFIVVTHVLSPGMDSLSAAIRNAGIPLFETGPLPEWMKSENLCPCDLHPTGKINEYMAEKIKEILQRVKNEK